MWKIYGREGVAVVTTVEAIENAILSVRRHYNEGDTPPPAPTIEISPVEYSVAPGIEPWLRKRSAFVHEREARMYCVDEHSWSDTKIQVDLKALIKGIRLSPFTPKWAIEAIKATIRAFLKGV
jgi:hypothetical protein